MAINKLEIQILLEIVLNQKINDDREIAIPYILNLYMRKLNCIGSAIYSHKKLTNIKPKTLKLNVEWNKKLEDFIDEIDKSNTEGFYKNIDNYFFYALPLYKDEWLILIRKNIFLENMFFELLKVVSHLGIDMKQSKEEERLKLIENLFDKSRDSVQISEESGKLYYINEEASRRLGIKKSEIENYYVSDIEKIFKNNDEKWKNHVKQLKKIDSITIEGEHINQSNFDTTPVEVNVRLSKVKDKNFVIAISRDISKRKKQELKLIETTQKLESIFNEMTDVVYSIKLPSKEVLFVTPSIKSILEISEEEFINNPEFLKNIIASKDKDLLADLTNQLNLYGKFNIKFKIKTNSGEIKWIRNKGKYIYDNNFNPVRLDGVISDRTKQYLTNKSLDNEIKLQDALIDIASTYINLESKDLELIINSSLEKMGRFVKADRAYIFDYDFNLQTTSNTFEWCRDGVEPEIDNLQKISIENIPQFLEKHKNGQPFYVTDVALLNNQDPGEKALKDMLAPQGIKSLITIPILNNNDLIGFVGFDFVKKHYIYSEKEIKILSLFGMMLINIRDKQNLNKELAFQNEEKEKRSDELAIANKELAYQNNEKDKQADELALANKELLFQNNEKEKRADELAKAIATAKAASKAKELFLANMSHEIRTPLNVIIGMIQLLNKEKLIPNQYFYVSQSLSSAKHLLTILNNILDISKIESGDMELLKKDFSLSALVYNVNSILFSQAKEKNIKFKLNINPKIYTVLIGDDTRLKQVLINLIGNSIKFTDKGKINLKVGLVNDYEDTQKLRFEVSDTGIGMSEDFLFKIFDKFSQEQNTSNRQYEGTGLGMAISNDLVKLMGGTMIVESVKNKGTKCIFELTFEKGNINDLKPTIEEVKEGAFKGKKVLLVEDNEMNRFIATRSLDYLGFETTEAENGLIATKLIKEQNFDLVLMDIQMPIMDGMEATIFIRENLQIQTPIIALTANAFKHDINLYLKVGMNDIIIKPFDENDLFIKIGCVLNLFNNNKKSKNLVLENEKPNVSKKPLYDFSKYQKRNRIDDDFIKKIIVMFIDLVFENTILLEKALEKEDVLIINKIVHKLKPNIKLMGIISLNRNVKEILEFDLNSVITLKYKSNTQKIIHILRATSESLKKSNLI
jgi:PAS domain S-box-containing protein